MRIALFTETFLPKIDGVVNTLCHLLDHLSKTGHQSILVAPSPGPEQYAATRVVTRRAMSLPLYPEMRLAPPWRRIPQEVEAFGPDLVHVLNPISLGVAAMSWARRRRLPLVASYHTDLPRYVQRYGCGALVGTTWRLLRRLHNQADLNLAPSRTTRDQLAEHGFERLMVWPHGVDAQCFHPRFRDPGMRKRLTRGNPAALLLLYVGRLAREKRIDDLLPVVRALPGAQLALVGDGPDRARLERCFAGTRTAFIGYLQGDELAAAYATADIFTFPSDSETFGNVVVEAMASGVPVVAAAAGGPLDLVAEGQTGYLTAPGDPLAILRAVMRLAADPALARQLGQAGRQHAESLSWPLILDGVLCGYEQALAERRDRATVDRVASQPWTEAMRLPGGLGATSWVCGPLVVPGDASPGWPEF
jgi:glycosyltransferase involved in cell wall biosynthesis